MAEGTEQAFRLGDSEEVRQLVAFAERLSAIAKSAARVLTFQVGVGLISAALLAAVVFASMPGTAAQAFAATYLIVTLVPGLFALQGASFFRGAVDLPQRIQAWADQAQGVGVKLSQFELPQPDRKFNWREVRRVSVLYREIRALVDDGVGTAQVFARAAIFANPVAMAVAGLSAGICMGLGMLALLISTAWILLG